MHYVYVRLGFVVSCCLFTLYTDTQTLPAVTVTMILVGIWAWTDIEVKRLQVCSPTAINAILDRHRPNAIALR